MKGFLNVALAASVLSWSSFGHAGRTLHLQSGSFDPAIGSHVGGSNGRIEQGLDKTYKLWIVQYEKAITPQNRRALQRHGYRVVSYIPNDAYLIEVPTAVSDLKIQPLRARTAVPYLGEYKLSPRMPRISIFSQAQTESFTVVASSAEAVAGVGAQLDKIGIRVLNTQGDLLIVNATQAQANQIAQLNDVVWIEPTTKMEIKAFPVDQQPQDESPVDGNAPTELTGYESGTKVMNAPAAWERGFTGRGQVVAAADTGLDSGEASTLKKDFENFKMGRAYGRFSWSWKDTNGHGTHVMGSVGSTGADSNGLITGSAKGAGLIMQGLWSPLGGLTLPKDLGGMMLDAYSAGARVHTNSWGSAEGPDGKFGHYTAEARDVDSMMWTTQDYLVLFAAGNSGQDLNKDGRIDEDSMASPGTAKNVLTVGASENLLAQGGNQKKMIELGRGKQVWSVEPLASDTFSNNSNGMAVFSSRGPTRDGRVKPDIVAPGTNIVSNCSNENGASKLWGAMNALYCYSGGTSMATPLTAGAAAVARDYLIEQHKFQSPSAALVKNILMHTAFDMFPGQFGAGGAAAGQELLVHRPDNNQGFGRVDLAQLVAMDTAKVVDDRDGLAVNQEAVYEVTVPANNVITASLVYTDAPGSLSAGKTLVNDLDMDVLLDDAVIKMAADRTNNHEFVEMPVVQGGNYKFKVKAINVPVGRNDRQPYSLVISFRPATAVNPGNPPEKPEIPSDSDEAGVDGPQPADDSSQS